MSVRHIGARFGIFLMALFFLAAANTLAQEDPISDEIVHFDIMPYLVLGGISGDMTIRNQRLPVNESASDILNHLQFGFMARSAVSLNRWFAGTDLTYLGLGGSASLVNVGLDQWDAELLGGYRVTRHLRTFLGVRYNNITSKFRFQGPQGIIRSGSQTWWDPFVGGQLEMPLGKRLSASARLDVGGFGAGSRIAVNAEPLVSLKLTRTLTTAVGWKFLYQDYVNSGQRFEYDILAQGPFVGFNLRF